MTGAAAGILAIALVLAMPVRAAEALVAVASNFLSTAELLAQEFEERTDHEVTIIYGSTGQLYAKIVSGAPFDLFLSADTESPRGLTDGGWSVERRPYALGRLVLVSRRSLEGWPESASGARVGLANPEVAPYGAAARAYLDTLGPVAETFELRQGENVGQTAGLLLTGNADFVLVAASLLPDFGDGYEVREIDTSATPIVQDAVLLRRGADNPAAQGFFEFLTGPEGRAIIADAGYGLPG